MQQGTQERGQLCKRPIYYVHFHSKMFNNSPKKKQDDDDDPAGATELSCGARRHCCHAVGALQKLWEATQRNDLRNDYLRR